MLPTRPRTVAWRDSSIKLAMNSSLEGGHGAVPVTFDPARDPSSLYRAEFGLYTTVNFTLATMALLQIGIGPALAHGLSRAKAKDDDATAREQSSTAFFMMAGMAAIAGVLLPAGAVVCSLAHAFWRRFRG